MPPEHYFTCSENCPAFARMKPSSVVRNWLHNPRLRATSKAVFEKEDSYSAVDYGRSGFTLVLDRTVM